MNERNEFGETAEEYLARQCKYNEKRQAWLRDFQAERQAYQEKIEAEKAKHFEAYPLQKLTIYELTEQLAIPMSDAQRNIEREALRRILLWIEDHEETQCRLRTLE